VQDIADQIEEMLDRHRDFELRDREGQRSVWVCRCGRLLKHFECLEDETHIGIWRRHRKNSVVTWLVFRSSAEMSIDRNTGKSRIRSILPIDDWKPTAEDMCELGLERLEKWETTDE
jgi:hypothetical protein